MATFAALAKIYSTEFLQYKGSWAWPNFCQAKVFTYTVFYPLTLHNQNPGGPRASKPGVLSGLAEVGARVGSESCAHTKALGAA